MKKVKPDLFSTIVPVDCCLDVTDKVFLCKRVKSYILQDESTGCQIDATVGKRQVRSVGEAGWNWDESSWDELRWDERIGGVMSSARLLEVVFHPLLANEGPEIGSGGVDAGDGGL
ncbi:hypothetical protein CRUP_008538, partial [Coryphaenoides rupestris]